MAQSKMTIGDVTDCLGCAEYHLRDIMNYSDSLKSLIKKTEIREFNSIVSRIEGQLFLLSEFLDDRENDIDCPFVVMD
ncbi:hypothetical protein LCGC14_2470350 [marine sediment metagenome]|uniref:Uncharacterized protein n=1 Tax=marine sediment metagenome TaxID=412755 RepID=A0A0F9E4I7_9ZZZZ